MWAKLKQTIRGIPVAGPVPTLSLDVIFHLVEDSVYEAYMARLFSPARKFVIIYSSDFDIPQKEHERNRAFQEWVAANRPDWTLLKRIPNRFPYDSATRTGSLASFYIHKRQEKVNVPGREGGA